MNFAIKFKDLLNLAIGDPERGVLNSSVLYILLQSIIEHLKLEEQMKVLPGSEEDYLSSTFSLEKLTKALPGSGGDSLPSGPIQLKSEEKSEEGEENKVYHIQFDSIKIFDQRLSAMEKQMAFLEALPSTEQLLESSHFLKTPAKDMWQMLKLKKKVEGNEEGMTKAMDTLQDLLTTICGLQADINFFKTKLEEMKKKMDKINPEEISKTLEELEEQHEQIKNLQFDMEEVKNKLLSFPERSDIMQWTTLHDAMYSQADTNEISEKAGVGIPEVTSEVTPKEATSKIAPEVTSKVDPKVTSIITHGVTSEVTSEEAPKTSETSAPHVKTAKLRPDTKSQTLSAPLNALGKALNAVGITVSRETLNSLSIAIDPNILSALGISTDPNTLAAMGIKPVPGAGFSTDQSSIGALFAGPPGPSFPEPTGPSSTGPTDPSSTGPTDPSSTGSTGLSFAGLTGPSFPGPIGPSFPGTTDSSFPGFADPLSTGPTGPSFPGFTRPSSTGPHGPPLPGSTGPSFPGSTGPSFPGPHGPPLPGPTDPSFPGPPGPSFPGPTGQSFPGSTGQSFPGPTGPSFPEPTGPSFPGPPGPSFPGPTGQSFSGLTGQSFSGLTGQSFPSTTGPSSTEPIGPLFSGPTGSFSEPTGPTEPADSSFPGLTGPSFSGPIDPSFPGSTGPSSTEPTGPSFPGPTGSSFPGSTGPSSIEPAGSSFPGPIGPPFPGPAGPSFSEPSGPSFPGLTGPSSTEPIGPSFIRPTGPVLPGPTGPSPTRHAGPSFPGPTSPSSIEPIGPSFTRPTGPVLPGPTGPSSTRPTGPSFPGPTGPSFPGSTGPSFPGPTGPSFLGPTGLPFPGLTGPLSTGPTGPSYTGPTGPSFPGSTGPSFPGPTGPSFLGPTGLSFPGPTGPLSTGPTGPSFTGPTGPPFPGLTGPSFPGPTGSSFIGPTGPSFLVPTDWSFPGLAGPSFIRPTAPSLHVPTGPSFTQPTGPFSTGPSGPLFPVSTGPPSTGPIFPPFTSPSLPLSPSFTAKPLAVSPGFTWNPSSFLAALGVIPDEATLNELGIDPNADSLISLGLRVDPATLVALAILTGKSFPSRLYPSALFSTLPEASDLTTGKAPTQGPERMLSSTKFFKQLPPDQPLSVQGKRQTAKKSVGCLINLPMECDSLKEQLTKLDDKVQQLANQIGSLGLIPRLETEMSILQDKIHTLQELGQKSITCEKHLLRVEEQCNLLEKIIEALQDKMEDIKGLKLAVLQLEKEKADKIWMEEQMREKADKSALAFKANQEDLEFAKIHLNEMMFDILQKISIHEKDWRKVLEKLFFDMDSKLNHMDLDPVKKQMEHMWKFIKKSLMEGPRFDAETAAGFRKQLFDRMKCISCDRPVNIMTSPQLISVRNLDISHHDRPVSANSYEYLKQLKLREMQQLQPMTNTPERGDMPTDGQARLDNTSLRRIVKMPNLTTIHPYGDPSVFPPPNSEVNILGVDGNLYKGRMGLRGTPRSFMTEKDLAGLKVPKPPSSRKVPEYSSISNVLYPASRPRTSLTAQVLQQSSQPMMPSGILQHSPSSANLSPKIPSTKNRPTTKATTSGSPFTRKFGKSSKSRSASLPTSGLNPNSQEEGTNM